MHKEPRINLAKDSQTMTVNSLATSSTSRKLQKQQFATQPAPLRPGADRVVLKCDSMGRPCKCVRPRRAPIAAVIRPVSWPFGDSHRALTVVSSWAIRDVSEAHGEPPCLESWLRLLSTRTAKGRGVKYWTTPALKSSSPREIASNSRRQSSCGNCRESTARWRASNAIRARFSRPRNCGPSPASASVTTRLTFQLRPIMASQSPSHPGTNEHSVAEQAVALLTAVFRDTHTRDREIRRGIWRRDCPRRLAGNTMGLVGLGRIGKAMVPRCRGLGLDVIAFDPYPDTKFAASTWRGTTVARRVAAPLGHREPAFALHAGHGRPHQRTNARAS